MFVDLSWSHMLLVLVIALVVVGPKDLPKVMREMGRWAAKARAMADQFRRSFDEMARQSDLDELRKELDELRNVRPFAEAEEAMSKALQPPAMVSMSQTPAESEADVTPDVTHELPPEPSEPGEMMDVGMPDVPLGAPKDPT